MKVNRCTALVVAIAACVGLVRDPAASADAGLSALNGTWRGDGTLQFDDGPAEKLACLGYYKSPSDGQNLSIAIRCHGDPDKLELRAKLDYVSGKMSGTWEERTYNASGAVTGTANEKNLDLSFSGSLDGKMSIAFSPTTQSVSVTISTADTGLKGAQISLNRH